MANPEHLYILKQGVDTWNQWRHDSLFLYRYDFDLRNPDLSESNLSNFYLSNVNLDGVNLSGANLFGVRMGWTK